jgi:hemerythrin-like domain-containing protein
MRRAERRGVHVAGEFALRAIAIIQDEHRTLAAVLHGLLFLVREIRDRGATPDFALLGSMLHYVDLFPERFHHPKEDRYLFALLRTRHPPAGPLIDLLQNQHEIGADKIRELEQRLARFREGGAAEFPAFADAVEAYAVFHWDHLRREERDVIPLAKEHLTSADWEVIDAAFAGHTDPLLGTDQGVGFEALFRRIVDLAPPPIGVGPMR